MPAPSPERLTSCVYLTCTQMGLLSDALLSNACMCSGWSAMEHAGARVRGDLVHIVKVEELRLVLHEVLRRQAADESRSHGRRALGTWYASYISLCAIWATGSVQYTGQLRPADTRQSFAGASVRTRTELHGVRKRAHVLDIVV